MRMLTFLKTKSKYPHLEKTRIADGDHDGQSPSFSTVGVEEQSMSRWKENQSRSPSPNVRKRRVVSIPRLMIESWRKVCMRRIDLHLSPLLPSDEKRPALEIFDYSYSNSESQSINEVVRS